MSATTVRRWRMWQGRAGRGERQEHVSSSERAKVEREAMTWQLNSMMRGVPAIQERAAEMKERQRGARTWAGAGGSTVIRNKCCRQAKERCLPASRTAGSDEGVWGEGAEGEEGQERRDVRA